MYLNCLKLVLCPGSQVKSERVIHLKSTRQYGAEILVGALQNGCMLLQQASFVQLPGKANWQEQTDELRQLYSSYSCIQS